VALVVGSSDDRRMNRVAALAPQYRNCPVAASTGGREPSRMQDGPPGTSA
jgi:hypothetical protein